MGHIYLGRFDVPQGVPQELIDTQRWWAAKAHSYGDKGGCVIGAGFEFTYKRKPYFMPPVSAWQGSLSWEAFVNEVEAKLKALGCTNIRYNWGNLD